VALYSAITLTEPLMRHRRNARAGQIGKYSPHVEIGRPKYSLHKYSGSD